MTLEELFEMLDIESGSEFEYFENFADLVESDEDIDSDLIVELLRDADMKVFAELTESYFYDTMENVPQDQIDLYNLLETIKRNFIGMSQAVQNEEDNAIIQLSDEINRFRQWYSLELNCNCKDESTNEVFNQTVRDAICDSRMEKIGGHELVYDFSKAAEYEIEEFIMTYGDMVDDNE